VWRTLSTRRRGLSWSQAFRLHCGRPSSAGILPDSVHPVGDVWNESSSSLGSGFFQFLRGDAERSTWMSSRCVLLLRMLDCYSRSDNNKTQVLLDVLFNAPLRNRTSVTEQTVILKLTKLLYMHPISCCWHPVSMEAKLFFVEPGSRCAHSPSPIKVRSISYQGTM